MNIETSDLIVPGIIFAGLAALFVASGFWRERMRRRYGKTADTVFAMLHAPVEVMLAITAIYAAMRSIDLRWTRDLLFQQLYTVVLIVAMAWLAKRCMDLAFALNRRKPQGRLRLLRNLVVAAIALVALACILLTFGTTAAFGAGLLNASALALLILGVSAHRALGTMFTGLQVALAQPIRPGDEIVIDGRQGRVEELHLTFMAMASPDAGRVIVPITALAERPYAILSRAAPPASSPKP